MTFTLQELIAFMVAAAGFAVTLLTLHDKVSAMRLKAKQPQTDIENRISNLEKWKDSVDGRLDRGDNHFDKLDEGNKVTQRALLALMDAALNRDNGNEELIKARKELYEYLSDK